MSKKVRQLQNTLSSSLKRRVAYSLAAGAAAGAATDGKAAVVYSGLQNINVSQFSSQNLDLDLDGNIDVKLKNYVFGTVNYEGASMPFVAGKLQGFKSGSLYYVSALSAGAPINAGTIGPTFYGSMAYGAANPNAEFNTASNAYFGFGFPSGSNFFYGWVRVGINQAAGTFLIKDWAYEKSSDVGILAGASTPEPGTLGMLAAGAVGVLALRRRRAATA
jgi:PEP-CTERM motif